VHVCAGIKHVHLLLYCCSPFILVLVHLIDFSAISDQTDIALS